jgi:FAD/FMN-containing dehydrogenase
LEVAVFNGTGGKSSGRIFPGNASFDARRVFGLGKRGCLKIMFCIRVNILHIFNECSDITRNSL